MLSWLANAWRVPELRRRVLFTAFVLAAYRLGSWIPAPGVNASAIQSLFGGGVLGLLSLFSGGALARFSIFALGIMPYVTASIVIQLLTAAVPRLEELKREGRVGTGEDHPVHAVLHGDHRRRRRPAGYAYLFHRSGGLKLDTGRLVLIMITLAAGTTLLMWMGEQITKRGVGNGISLLIFASILTSAPAGIHAWVNGGPVEKLFFPIVALARRRLGRLRAGGPAADPDPVREEDGGPAPDGRPVDLHAAAREHGGRDPGDLRRDAARAAADARRVPAEHPDLHQQELLADARGAYLLVEAILIILFTFFYTSVTFNPVDQADELRKYGGYIPGIRPGPPTAIYLDRVLTRLTLPGSLFLATVAVLPSIFINEFNFSQATSRALGGTSVLIVVGVALDTMRQMESQMMMRSYEGFLR